MRFAKFCFFVFLSTASVFSAQANESSGSTTTNKIYIIENIKIEILGAEAEIAKTEALVTAKKQAFQRLVKRFLTYGYISQAPSVSFEQIDNSIESIMIVEEFSTPEKYELRFNINFQPSKVSSLIGVDLAAAKNPKEKYLLVPVLVENNIHKPWDAEWFGAWKGKMGDSITLPLGDLFDIQSFSAEQLTRLDYRGLDTLARRYQMPVILVIEGDYQVLRNKLFVTIKRFEDTPRLVAQYEYAGHLGIGSKELFAKAAADLLAKIEAEGMPKEGKDLESTLAEQDIFIEYERNYDGEKGADDSQVKTKVITRSLADWSVIRRKINNSKLVNKIIVNSTDSDHTDIEIYHVGNFQELRRSLLVNGLQLKRSKEGYIIKTLEIGEIK